mmetsp:Transcript_49729/g.112950  ORF Transcript_49729/g.112950 Transcript_49729/m.112950 type:complete len:209 (+) Transcript_49729:1053-1679(+)
MHQPPWAPLVKPGTSAPQSARPRRLRSRPRRSAEKMRPANEAMTATVSPVFTRSTTRFLRPKVIPPVSSAGAANSTGKGALENTRPNKSADLAFCAARVSVQLTANRAPAMFPRALPPADRATESTLTWLQSAGFVSARILARVASANDKPQTRRNIQQTTIPTAEGRSPGGAVAYGSARNPPPIEVPARIVTACNTVAFFSEDLTGL